MNKIKAITFSAILLAATIAPAAAEARASST